MKTSTYFSNKNLINNLLRAVIFLSLVTFYSYQYIFRLLPNVIMPFTHEKYGINANDFASFAASYYLGYFIFHIPIGVMMNRLGCKLIVTLSIIFCSLGVIPLLFSENWYLVILGRFITGIGSSTAIIAAFQVFRKIFPKHYSQAIGANVFCSLIIMKIAGKYLSEMINDTGMQESTLALMTLGLVLALVSYIVIPNLKSQNNESIIQDIKQVLLNKKFVIISLCAGLMVGPLEGFSDAWASLFLTKAYKIQKVIADEIVFYIFMGMAIGSLCLPYIAKKFNIEYNINIYSAIFMLLFFSILLSGAIKSDLISWLLFILGFFSAYQVVLIPLLSTYVTADKAAFASSITNMIIMSFGNFFHKTIGFTLNIASNGSNIYSLTGIQYSLLVIPISLLVAFLILFVIKDK